MTFSSKDYDFRNTIVNTLRSVVEDDPGAIHMLLHLLKEYNEIKQDLNPLFQKFIESLLDDEKVLKMSLDDLKKKYDYLKSISM